MFPLGGAARRSRAGGNRRAPAFRGPFWSAIKHDYENGLPGDGTLAERGARYEARLLRRYGVTPLEDVSACACALRRLERSRHLDPVRATHHA